MLHLHFHGPYRVCSETDDVLEGCQHSHSTGVYLWTVQQTAGSYRVLYVGETERSFYSRIKEHAIQTLGGNYRIIDPELMQRGVERVLWDGLWRRHTLTRLPEFLVMYEALAPVIKRYLTGQSAFLAPLQADKQVRRRVEGAIAKHLRASPETCSLLPADIRYRHRRRNEAGVRVTLSSDQPIDGLPIELEA